MSYLGPPGDRSRLWQEQQTDIRELDLKLPDNTFLVRIIRVAVSIILILFVISIVVIIFFGRDSIPDNFLTFLLCVAVIIASLLILQYRGFFRGVGGDWESMKRDLKEKK